MHDIFSIALLSSIEFRRKAGLSRNLITPSAASPSDRFEQPMQRAVRNAHWVCSIQACVDHSSGANRGVRGGGVLKVDIDPCREMGSRGS